MCYTVFEVMKARLLHDTLKYLILILMLSVVLLFSSCSADVTQDDPPNIKTADETEAQTTTETVSETGSKTPTYAYTFILDSGDEKTITLYGSNPADSAELHLVQLDNTDILNRVVLHREVSGTGVSIEHAHVFDGSTGEALPITGVSDTIAQYVTVSSEETAWILSVAGTEYRIEKTQFSDCAPEELFESPDFSAIHDFSVENGQLICTVRILCAGSDTGFATESLRIRYGYSDGAILPVELSFIRTENSPNSPVTNSIEAEDAA